MARFILSGFADEIDSDLKVQVRELKRLNIDRIEIRGVYGKSIIDYTEKEAREFKNCWMTRGLRFRRWVRR